jgi:hypothetical protein
MPNGRSELSSAPAMKPSSDVECPVTTIVMVPPSSGLGRPSQAWRRSFAPRAATGLGPEEAQPAGGIESGLLAPAVFRPWAERWAPEQRAAKRRAPISPAPRDTWGDVLACRGTPPIAPVDIVAHCKTHRFDVATSENATRSDTNSPARAALLFLVATQPATFAGTTNPTRAVAVTPWRRRGRSHVFREVGSRPTGDDTEPHHESLPQFKSAMSGEIAPLLRRTLQRDCGVLRRSRRIGAP